MKHSLLKRRRKKQILEDAKRSVDSVSEGVTSFFGCGRYDFLIDIGIPKRHSGELSCKVGDIVQKVSLGKGRTLASISPDEGIIMISPKIGSEDPDLKETLYHEMTHGYQFRNNRSLRKKYFIMEDALGALLGGGLENWEQELPLWIRLIDSSVDYKLHLESTGYSYDLLRDVKEKRLDITGGVTYRIEAASIGDGLPLEKIFGFYTDMHASDKVTEGLMEYAVLKARNAYSSALNYAKEIFFDWDQSPCIKINLEESDKSATLSVSVFYETIDYDDAEARVKDFFYSDCDMFMEKYLERQEKRSEIILDQLRKRYPHLMK